MVSFSEFGRALVAIFVLPLFACYPLFMLPVDRHIMGLLVLILPSALAVALGLYFSASRHSDCVAPSQGNLPSTLTSVVIVSSDELLPSDQCSPKQAWAWKAAKEAPELYDGDVPSKEYLENTEKLLRALTKQLATMADGTVPDKKPLEKVGIKHESGFVLCVNDDNAVIEMITRTDQTDLETLSKQLHQLLMRYPQSAELTSSLKLHGFQWVGRPLRGDALNNAARCWTDTSASASDSSFFSSMGIWTSPYALPYFGVGAALGSFYAAWALAINPTWDTVLQLQWMMVLGWVVSSVVTIVLLWRGHRRVAQILFAVYGIISMILGIMDVTSMACQCWGPYAKDHVPLLSFDGKPVKVYQWQWILSSFISVMGHGFMNIGLALTPQWTFQLVVYDHGFVHLVMAIIFFTDGLLDVNMKMQVAANSTGAASSFGLGVFLFMRRRYALGAARELGDLDARRYHKLWTTMLALPGFRDALEAQQAAWDAMMQEALRLPKLQLSACSLGELFLQADRLNDHFQRKIYTHCNRNGGQFHFVEVKAQVRTLQKMYRTYNGDWRKLCDLVRTSLIFVDLPSLTACMRDITADPELKVLFASDSKMRLSDTHDAQGSGGYRDVQICLWFDSPQTHALGVHGHIAEVQLHLSDIAALKSEGGHARYVLRRNLSGS